MPYTSRPLPCRHLSLCLPLPLAFPTSAHALPLHSPVPHAGINLLIVFVILACFFLLTFSLKQLFIQSRRICAVQPASSVVDPSRPLPRSRPWSATTPGIIVGLLGSPYWETRLGDHRQLKSHPGSYSSQPQKKPGSSGFTVPTSRKTSRDSDQTFTDKKTRHSRVHKVILPVYPSKIYSKKVRPSSLPSHPSTKLARFERPRNSTFPLYRRPSWLENPPASSLRLVKSSKNPEIPLPLSDAPLLARAKSLDGLKADSPTTTVISPPQSQDQTTSNPFVPSGTASFVPTSYIRQRPSRLESIFEESSMIFDDGPNPDCSWPYDRGPRNPSPTRKPYALFSTVLGEGLEDAGNESATPQISPTLSSFPKPPSSPILPQGEKMFTKEYQSVRHSPASRPSPLRKMRQHNSPMSGSVLNHDHSEPNLAERRTSDSPGNNFGNDNDPNGILGMIRELVEETNEWDSSLFMNENFKNMIQESKLCLRPQETVSRSFSQPNVVEASAGQETTPIRSIRSSTDLVFPFWEGMSLTESIHGCVVQSGVPKYLDPC